MKRGYKRLLKLADHLESDKRGHDRFDFSKYHIETECGTAGCALGECPTIWKTWKLRGELPCIKRNATTESASLWFEISTDAARHLFYKNCQEPYTYGGNCLGGNATAHEVAENIRAFVKLKLEQPQESDQ